MIKPARRGVFAAAALISLYFIITSFVSGLTFAIFQFEKYWYFIVVLALGFGIQVGLYVSLGQKATKVSPGVVGTTGVTSTAAITDL